MLGASSLRNSSHTMGIEITTTASIAHADAFEAGPMSDRVISPSVPASCCARSGIHTNQQTEAIRPRPYSFPLTYPPESIAKLATAELKAYRVDAPNR